MLSHEEHAFNTQIISYKQNQSSKTYEAQENPENISEVGNNIITNNLKRAENPEGGPPETPLLCAKCMYELYMVKGIIPETNGKHRRTYSDTRSSTNGDQIDMERKIQKEMLIAKHCNSSPTAGASTKPGLISAAHKTIAGYDYKPTMLPKQKMLKSNFAELSGATSLIEEHDKLINRTLLDVSCVVNP